MGWREDVLERDKYECQLGKLFGIAEISGVPCSEDLQVHHITYKRYGHEEPEDGITVCQRCHDLLTDMIRQQRNLTRTPLVQEAKETRPSAREQRESEQRLLIQETGDKRAREEEP